MSAAQFDLLLRMGLTAAEIACASEPGPWARESNLPARDAGNHPTPTAREGTQP